ncbi:ABC transporter permease [Sphingomonas lutea]|uniref:ABC transporter permease n=1 Tax=Sphingomonas lutea TaxID=1045317 RepID=UPI001F38FADA|nr:FtsX-like permease family protein [Sphingomonas lutea]
MSGRWAFAARLARRDLNRSLRGLRLLFLCIFLGVATLAAIGSLTSAITGELADRGRVILGGDLQVGMSQRRATAEERAALARAGTLSETIRLRSMARAADGSAVLAELKAVDALYPLYGTLRVDGRPARAPTADAIFIAPELGERLSVGRGETLRFGNTDFRVAGIVDEEPDRIGEGFTLGPVAIVSSEGLARTGLIQPGSLYDTRYRLKLPPSSDPKAVTEAMKARFPAASWEFRDRDRGAPGASRFFDRLGQFLTLVGLAALIIAGIGVSNGVASYLRQKQDGIATLKMLGATSADIGRVYFVQIGLVTLAATLCGLAVGALLPPLAIAIAGDLLPVRPGFQLHPLPLLVSAAYGLLMALMFVLLPLGRARRQPVATLFREMIAENRTPDRRTLLMVAGAGAAIVALAVGTSDNPLFAASIIGAIAGTVLLLAGLGWLVRRAARAVPRPRRPLLRLALTGLHRPGAQTVGLVVALGLALTLFVTLAAVQTSLSAEIDRAVPERAPDQFVLDIPATERARFEGLVRQTAPAADLNVVPNLRGTITAYGNTRVADLKALPDGAWFLRGERGVTYSPGVPEGSEVVAGTWWPADYRGRPLVSLDREAAEILGLGVGDRMTVSVLGREIEARIASLREIHWDTMGFNYILVFPPSTLQSAPHNLAATISGDVARQPELTRAVLRTFPSASIVDVGELISEVGTILEQMAAAILVAASVAVLAGIAVLIGALAASRQARSYDSVILKTLGATRAQVLGTQVLEYALIALLLSGAALVLGLTGAWFVIVQLFEFTWSPDWAIILATLGAGAFLTLTIALLGSLPLLNLRPAAALRSL